MDDALLALGRRAVACQGWRWLGGARDAVSGARWPFHAMPHLPIPDLSDPATLGCLLVLAREAWGRCDLTPRANRACTEWVIDMVGTPDVLLTIIGSTEAEAIVAALEAGWTRPCACRVSPGTPFLDEVRPPRSGEKLR